MDSIVRSSSHSGTISIKVTGLTPGTTYYSKPFASNNLGTGYGDIDQFTTDDFLVTTNPISLITQTTARCGGYIPGNGGVSIIARGVCWDVSPNPTTALNKTVDGSGTGTFVSDLTGLRPSTTYYARAYVSAREGTAYGSEKIFTTTQAAIPTVTTTAISSVTVSSAVTGGTVTSDGGATVTDRGICWNTTGNPTVTNSKISLGSGSGSYSGSLSGLQPNSLYFIKAYAVNSSGTGYGNEVILRTYGGTVTDIDGNIYNTVNIGNQSWMVGNLKTTKFSDGSAIPLVTENTIWSGLTTPGRCWYNNSEMVNKDYGQLYNWYAVNTTTLCPAGWHVPTDAEWTTMTTYLGSLPGAQLKEAGTLHWTSNTNGTNRSGFTGLPGGYRTSNGTFSYIGSSAYWWTSTLYYTTRARYRSLTSTSTSVVSSYNYLNYGFSVRCMKVL